MNVFVLCAGDGARWNNHLGVPKQLVKCGGEALLERLSRLLSAYTDLRLYCAVGSDEIRLEGACNVVVPRSKCLAHTMLETREYWGEKNAFLLGDVFYSRAAVRRIVCCARPLAFFGRPWPSRLVRCGHGELFGMVCHEEAVAVAGKLLRRGVLARAAGHEGNLWNLHHMASGLALGECAYNASLLEVIDDYTNDIDTPADYERRHRLFEQVASGSFRMAPRLAAYRLSVLGRRLECWRRRRRALTTGGFGLESVEGRLAARGERRGAGVVRAR